MSRPPVELAADALRRGELVVMPTETVYGLAADARNRGAIARIFAVKGRPADNPLIVHVAHAAAARDVVAQWPPIAERLAAALWPGPLTLVLPKRPSVPDAVTAGRPTVAVRVPAHPVAQTLLRAVGFPLAAPSANVFMQLSPTDHGHISKELAEAVAVVLPGGASEVGLESTILDLSGATPTLLRPGGYPRELLEAILGCRLSYLVDESAGGRAAPGRYARHYAPTSRLLAVNRAGDEAFALVIGAPRGPHHIGLPNDPVGYAAQLYAGLHTLDAQAPAQIEIELPPDRPEWEAVSDRIRRASHPGG